MCSFQVLSQNNCGYIVCCASCAHIQLAFYTTVLRMSRVSFDEFAERIHDECRHRYPCDEPMLKQVMIEVGEGVSMALTYNELKTLDNMLAESGALLEAYRILEELC